MILPHPLEPWDHKSWTHKFAMASGFLDRDTIYRLRIAVLRYNKKVVERGGYSIDGKQVYITPSPKSTIFNKEFKVEHHNAFDTKFSVLNEDCLQTARRLKDVNPLVLNMASRHTPGGGVENGAGAQEECLFRSSNYYTTLYPIRDFAYPMERNFGGIYSPNVTVFRGLEADGYPLLEEPFQVSFVAVAAIKGPHLTETGDYYDRERQGMKNKIRTILNIAIKFGHTNLILSAFGCGAFHNPPLHVATLFKEILLEEPYKGAFETVTFSIKEDHNDRINSNFKTFYEVFEPLMEQ